MIKRLLAVLCLCASAWATTTVSGNIKNLGTSAVSAGTFVRFYLRGCSGNLPRINGTAIIAPTLGNVFYFDFVPNASGAISGTLYSTRDATGLLGGDIECGGSTTAVWYGFVPFVNGKAGPETPIHAKNTATIDISNISPITTNPVITAPTGDSTYARIDGGNQPFTGGITAPSLVTSSINVNPLLLGGTLYPCTNTGLQAALAVVNLTGGDLDARSCSGTMAIAAFTLGCSGGCPVRLLVGPSTWNMSGSITINRGSSIIGTDNQSNNFNWTTDISGIITPTGTTGGLITLSNLGLNNHSLATAANAVVLLQDCPRCYLSNVIVSFASTAASAGIRLQAVTSNVQFGTWQGIFSNVVIQQGGGAGRATSGQIGLDMEGNSALTNGGVSLWTFLNIWIENQTTDIKCNLCQNNTWFGGNLYNAGTEVLISGNGTIASNGNAFINMTFNQVGVAGGTIMTIADINSNFNYISGNISGPGNTFTFFGNTTYISDAGSKNIHAVHTDIGDDFTYGATPSGANNMYLGEITAGARPAGVAAQDWLSGDSSSHCILASFNGGSFTNNCLLAANTAATIPATFTFTGNQIFGNSTISGSTGVVTKYNNIVTTGNGVEGVFASTGAVATGSGTSIGATSLCSTVQCPAGTYLIHAYLDITSACATTGGYIVWLGYTDDGGAKTGSSTTTFIPINGLGTTPSTGSLALASTTNYGQGTAVVRTTGAATGGLGSINYGTTAAACGSGGPMVGKLYLDVTRLE